ncbi:hypothetical protein HDK77DRAFT_164136 [Phyllosticta capitalensis]
MDQSNGDQPPDLATILNNLAALAQQQQQQQLSQGFAPQQQYQPPTGLPSTSSGASTSTASPYGNAALSSAPLFEQSPQNPLYANDSAIHAHAETSHVKTSTPIPQGSQASAYSFHGTRNIPEPHVSRSTTPQQISTPKPQAASAGKPPMIDPATILDWAQGLRCITKIAAQNPGIKGAVQKMIADQHENELMWWGGRRARTSQQVSPEELQAYDAKIHRAMREMFTAMSGHLKSLGVPFFGVKSDLIVKDEDSEKEKQALMAKKKITESELLKLQRKMLEYLEAMYKD